MWSSATPASYTRASHMPCAVTGPRDLMSVVRRRLAAGLGIYPIADATQRLLLFLVTMMRSRGG